MKRVKFGNILDAKGLIIQGVNCQGVMGSGVARDIRAKWPKVFEEYHQLTSARTGPKADLLGTAQFVMVEDDVIVVNLFSQEHFGADGRKYVSYKALQTGFVEVASLITQIFEVPPIVNYPMIGSGLGGGNWSIISEIIDSAFVELPTVERILWIKE